MDDPAGHAPSEPPRGPSPWQPPDSDYARYAGLGMQFAATIAVLGFAGYGLDRWLGTLPWFLIAGVGLGFLGGFLSLVRHVPPTHDRLGPPR